MRRETQNLLLILLGVALLKLGVNGDYLRYVKPSHQPWLLGAAVVVLVLGVVAIGRDVRTARRNAPIGAGAGHEHHRGARSAWLLVLPVLAVFLVAPPPLGADSVRRDAGAGQPSASSLPYGELPDVAEEPVVALSVSEFAARAARGGARTLVDRPVSLTGFVVREESGVLLARHVIGCCAADASAARVRLVGQAADGLGEVGDDTWLTVVGTVAPGSAAPGDRRIPALTVRTARHVPEPEDPYEY